MGTLEGDSSHLRQHAPRQLCLRARTRLQAPPVRAAGETDSFFVLVKEVRVWHTRAAAIRWAHSRLSVRGEARHERDGVPALFQSHGKVRARPGPSGEAICMAAPYKRHGGNDATRSLRV